MKHRYNVNRLGRRIASVIAESADEAIRIACQKTGTPPAECVAVAVLDK